MTRTACTRSYLPSVILGTSRRIAVEKRPLRVRHDHIVGMHEAQHLARNLLDNIGIGLFRREECYVAFKLGAHGLKTFDLELQQG